MWEKLTTLKERTVEVTGEGHQDCVRATLACVSLKPQLVCWWPKDSDTSPYWDVVSPGPNNRKWN